MNVSEWKGLIMEICAEYQCAAQIYKEIFGDSLSTAKYISQQLTSACKALVEKRITLDDFLLLSRLYGVFLNCYGSPPSEEEIMRFNLRTETPDMNAGVLCIVRAEKLYIPD